MSSETFELKSLNSPEEVRKFDKGKVEIVKVAGAAIGRAPADMFKRFADVRSLYG